MNLVTNSQIILEELFKQDFEENTLYSKESSFFEFFSAKNILKKKDFSDEEIESGILGDGGDGGCDAVYVLLNDLLMTEDAVENAPLDSKDLVIEFIIIQSKRETSFKEDVLMKWKTTIENLMRIDTDDTIYQARYNEDLLNVFSLFRKLYRKLLRKAPKFQVSFHYASFSTELHCNVREQSNELAQVVKRLYPSASVITKFWGADDLLIASQSQSIHKLNLSLTEPPINIGVHRDYVALVNLSKYYKFIASESGELRKYIFEANVRDYQGHNSVNQDIQHTLESQSQEEFWWLNNGITLLADEVVPVTNKELVLVEPAVVNGLQTSNEIFRYYQAHPEKLAIEVRNILVRIIVPENEDSRDRIILATNNQTIIPKSSLRANDPIHCQIEMYLKGKGLYYDRRKNYYKNQGKKSSDIISVSFLSQCMISLLLHKPDYARARPSTLLTNDDTYRELYIDNQDLDVFYHAAKLGRMIDSYLKQSNLYTLAQINDLLFYVLYCSVVCKVGKTNLSAQDIKSLDMNSFSRDYLLDIARRTFSCYTEIGGTSKIAKGPELIKLLRFKFDTGAF